MRTRVSKRFTLGAALVLATMAMNSALADGSRPFKIRVAGGFLQNVQQMQVDAMGIPTGMLESRSLAFVKGRGTFGKVDIMAVAVGGPPMSDKTCPAGLIKVADIVENNLVLTFNDLSLLYGDGTGVVCFDPTNPTAQPLAQIEGAWYGGTGRFKNASGNWSVQFDVAEAVGVTTQFIAETGVIKGRITGVGDDD